ncbi:hypothetical protein OPT61_g6202 [Boeremia exigua]|uniref:Uncharacterized protein n=1 Tax=Boeremia exigua TaxID=749465 RepID=A0ACC2I7T4_9PLEO|nr:hypothetical protein OPT61_g6202 [Boeremia exigua]
MPKHQHRSTCQPYRRTQASALCGPECGKEEALHAIVSPPSESAASAEPSKMWLTCTASKTVATSATWFYNLMGGTYSSAVGRTIVPCRAPNLRRCEQWLRHGPDGGPKILHRLMLTITETLPHSIDRRGAVPTLRAPL